MTIGKIIAEVDALRENAYTRAQKLQWLSRVEEALFQKVILTHEGAEEITYTPITADSPDTQPLLAPDAFAEVYLYYLLTQIDLHNGEVTRYNNSSALYNIAFLEFAGSWNRARRSLGKKAAKAPLM